MAEDSEKRFNAVMDKLFHAPPKPKQKPSDPRMSGVELSRGKKRPMLALMSPQLRGNPGEDSHSSSSVSGGSLQTQASQAPLCRPWDRADLFRRLATFKSMTWFAKPQAVSAVNCARRGWINIDMDIIACEACGARLLFPSPPSWTQQQVEKAALVFSLKLDSGHKLLCPWVDNICNENLAEFPPMPSNVLVDDYKKRCSALLQFLDLPLISSSTINYLRSPQLEQFLSTSTGESDKTAEASGTEINGNQPEAVSSLSYYQAQKFISLCGWEPHFLPYMVDYDDQSNHIVPVCTLSTKESMEGSHNNQASEGEILDSGSVLLECKLCGARVGLWAFSMVPRPLEFLRLTGPVDIGGEKDAVNEGDAVGKLLLVSEKNAGSIGGDINSSGTCSLSSNVGRAPNLKLTIAGGPPPAEQNYKAMISLPVIGRSLRARLLTDSELRDQFREDDSSLAGKDPKILVEGTKMSIERTAEPSNTITISGDKSKGTQIMTDNSSHNDNAPENALKVKTTDPAVTEQTESQVGEKSCSTLVHNVTSQNGKAAEPSNTNAIAEENLNDTQITADDSCHNDNAPECAENLRTVGRAVRGQTESQVGENSCSTSVDNITRTNGKAAETKTAIVEADNSKQVGKQREKLCPVIHGGKDLERQLLDRAMEFDPIRQHKCFCPWIASNGGSAPGWQQTLSALRRNQELSCPLRETAPPSSLVEVENPIASVKKIFSSPPAKRKKLVRPC